MKRALLSLFYQGEVSGDYPDKPGNDGVGAGDDGVGVGNEGVLVSSDNNLTRIPTTSRTSLHGLSGQSQTNRKE